MNQIQRNKMEAGQGLVEYALILVLVAVVSVVVLTVLGGSVSDVYCQVSLGLQSDEGCGDENTDIFCQIYTIEGYDAWNTHGEPFPGTYSAPWTSVSLDQPTDPGHVSCSVYGAWLP